MNWKEIITNCLSTLGGEAHYYDIYSYIEKTVDNKKLSKTWKATVRGTIERLSSDSQAFEKKEEQKEPFLLYTERSYGIFENRAKDEYIFKKFEKIREIIKNS